MIHDNAFLALSFARENLSFQVACLVGDSPPVFGVARHTTWPRFAGIGQASDSAKLHAKSFLEKLTSRTSRKAIVNLELARDCFQQPALLLPLLQRPHSRPYDWNTPRPTPTSVNASGKLSPTQALAFALPPNAS
jgi:hypothetical protein